MDKKVKLFIFILISFIVLEPIYFFLTFLSTLSSLTPNIITLVIAFLLAFIVFKKADNPIIPGVIISLLIFISLLVSQIYLSNLNIQTFTAPEFLAITRLIQNPILFFASFLVLFNLPFVIKAILNKRKKQAPVSMPAQPMPAA